MVQRIKNTLKQLGYRGADGGRELIWYKDQGREYGIILMIPEPLPGQPAVSPERMSRVLAEEERKLMISSSRPVRSLMLFFSRQLPSVSMVHEIAAIRNAWIIDCRDRRLMIFENQLEDFYGLRDHIEDLLASPDGEESSPGRERKEDWKEFLAPVNLTMILINILAFVVLGFLGDSLDPFFMAEHGAASWQKIVEQGQYWRLLTSGFLHFGGSHLFHNMVALLVIGSRLEKLKGHLTYFIIYIGSEVVSATTSLLVTLSGDRYSVSAGASGAVFGVIGALLCIAVMDSLGAGKAAKRKVGRISFLFMLGFALVGGVASPEIDQAAHIGGLIAGIVLMLITEGGRFLFRRQKKEGGRA